ncbi:uncharacterized protein LOC111890943 [Lactuca sativa]|uniref:Transcription factor IIIC 90kDa subunit N-terminal domain-containing protein n=1 Tax=Lactuca sativa TaxID=4236 RepID=A0A9R1V091_LACSA|nr:uncharacterized protein LOC111890943 [Lactuca sativa]KAJ0197617.1 hypothetical protein LSAT_V11C700347790 [Lactuca sativa]
MASRFQAVALVASPTYPNAISWSNENLVAVASGHLVTILNPAMPSGPKGLITIPTSKPFSFGVIERKDLLSGCMLPICLSRDIRPCVRSISWSPLGLAPNSGCLLAVCTTEGVVKVYHSPFREFSSEWVEVLDVSEMLHSYFEKIRYGESDSDIPFLEYNDDMPISKLLIRIKDKRQNLLEYHKRPSISAQQYASRSAMLSSLVVSWSPMFHGDTSSKGCSILAIGGKSGNISFWRVHEPQCYSITQRSKPPGALLIGLIQAHDSWITAISWSKFDSQLLLSTGSSDGSVKIWRGYTDDLAKSTEDGDAAFSLLKDVIKVGLGPTSVLSLIVPEASPQKILLAVGKGSGSLQVWIYDTLIHKFDGIAPLSGHDQIVTGLAWAYDGHCLYSCSQDNSLNSWIIKGDSLHRVSLPPNILGVKTFTDVPNVSDACFGIAVSPANLVVAVVRSFDVNLLNPMYEARSQKAAVEFFWIGGQNLGILKDEESDDENFPGFPNMDLVNFGQNILWSLNQYENLHKPLVLWDMIAALSAFKDSQPNYVEQILVKWLISNLKFEWGPPEIILPRVNTHLSNLTSRQLHLLNVMNRHVLLRETELDNNNGEQDLKFWIKILEMSEKELRERLVGCSFSATVKGYNGNLHPVGLAQMKSWVANNERVVKDYVKLLASKVKKIEKRYVGEEECSYCSSSVPFEDTEVGFCKVENHKLARCAVSMVVCPLTPLWFCVSCKRWVSNFAPESLFKLTRYPPTVDFEKRCLTFQNGEILLKPLCPFCGVLLQRLQPEFLLSTTSV